MVVDLSAGPLATNYPVRHVADVPAGGWTDEYKTTKLVLRRIPAGTFVLGAPTSEPGYRKDEAEHEVTLTQPFYAGVFEVTQKQWERVMGTWPSYFTNATCRDFRPVEQVNYFDVRGSGKGVGWPASGDVDPDSFMGRLRARTGKAFDLPTEAQWEYAGRAGAGTALNSGNILTATGRCPNLSKVGRHNGMTGCGQNAAASEGSAVVGSYLPNAAGLYDIHGNVWEWCLDWYSEAPGAGSDPKGAASVRVKIRALRGGGWDNYAVYCRVAQRGAYYSGNGANDLGFRAVLTQM
jgi:formylglycine-generating enzyme required for sulfatase activity